MPTLEDLLKLGLHETIIIDRATQVMAVQGGWIYTFYDDDAGVASTFVPRPIDTVDKQQVK